MDFTELAEEYRHSVDLLENRLAQLKEEIKTARGPHYFDLQKRIELLRYGCGRVLTAREQELIRLHYAEGQSLTAIAARQGRAVSSVSRSLRGARDKLYRFTEEAGRIGQLCSAARQQRL